MITPNTAIAPEVTAMKTAAPTTYEQHILLEKYDPISDDPVEKIAGLVLRSAVDIARYERSKPAHPQYYEKLIEATRFMAQCRLAMATEPGVEESVSITDVRAAVNAVNWDDTPTTPRPVITHTLPYDGTEPHVQLTFQDASTKPLRRDLIA